MICLFFSQSEKTRLYALWYARE